MKHSFLKTSLISLALLTAVSPYAMAGKGKQNAQANQSVSQLSVFESTSLKFMREEEKLAHDVYLSLYNRWGVPIFQNIANSEQTHTTKLKALIDKYGVEDPVKTEEVGVFTDPHFTELFNHLVEFGFEDYESALMVGMEIEELDIADIQEQLTMIRKYDITKTYGNLLKGSRNHLRSFHRLVEQGGFEYSPSHISQEEYDSIVTTEVETGPN